MHGSRQSFSLLASVSSRHRGAVWGAGPKEGALDLLWHPLRSCLASVSTTGKVSFYGKALLAFSGVYAEGSVCRRECSLLTVHSHKLVMYPDSDSHTLRVPAEKNALC